MANLISYNPLDALFSDAFNETFPLPDMYARPESVVTIEDEGDFISICIGDDGLTVTPEDAEAIAAKLEVALRERN